MLRSVLVFIHVVSALGLFAAIGIEGASLLQLRRATEPARLEAALSGYRWLRVVGAASMAGLVLSGAYLASTAWGWGSAWIVVSLAGIGLIAVLGARLTGSRIARLEAAAREGSAGPPERPANDPVLWLSFRARTAMLLGIVFLMTTKPGWEGSLVAMAVAIAAGVLLSLPGFRQRAGLREAA